MAKMTGGQALAKSLHREGVRVIFGIPGVQLYHALDGLYDEPEIRFITTRHEQAATYMADGYARAGGGIGTALVVPGPGLQNASAGVGTAYAASSPILVVAGQIQRELIGIDRGMLHEINDQLDIIRPITKWASRILNPAKIPEAIHEAFHQLRTGRPRPVEIEIPPETFEVEADIELAEPAQPTRAAGNLESIQKGADIIAGAKNPIIWAGGGVISSEAGEALQRLAEHLQAPVIVTAEGKGAISDRHYLSLGSLRNHDDPFEKPLVRFLQDHSLCDVVLAVGTRLATPSMLEGKQVVQIDIDENEIGRNYDQTFGIVGDARASLEEMQRIISATVPARPSHVKELDKIKLQREDTLHQVEPQASLVRAIRAAIPDDGVFVPDMTQVGYYSHVHYPVYKPRTYMTSSYFGNLGFAYPLALGAKVAVPDKAVVSASGDGGFLFNSQELATAVQHGINVVAIVFNDNAFGNVLRDQTTMFDGRTLGAKLHNPDFVKLAQAYGARGVRVHDAAKLESAIREALAVDAPTIIEVPVSPMAV